MAGKIKTRDRILQTSLALFNEEGENNVSTVDIAAVMHISPGNLYYHFKGKEAIINSLFDNFEEELKIILNAPVAKPLALDDNWIFIYIIFEEINDFRFFYFNSISILERCETLRPRFAKLMGLKKATSQAMLASLQKEGILQFHCGELERLAARLAAHLSTWLHYRKLADPGEPIQRTIQAGVYATIDQIVPYATGDRPEFAALIDRYYSKHKI